MVWNKEMLLRTIAFHIHLECTIKKAQEYLEVL
jgi:hypothetical protein